jgi:hypothetical protein
VRAALGVIAAAATAAAVATPALAERSADGSASLAPGHTPKAGRYHGPAGEPVSFRVAGGRIHAFRMVTTCGTYTVTSVPVHRGDFQVTTGPSTRPLAVYGRFATRTRADIEWNVGYTASGTPTCLLHDEWSALRRGP